MQTGLASESAARARGSGLGGCGPINGEAAVALAAAAAGAAELQQVRGALKRAQAETERLKHGQGATDAGAERKRPGTGRRIIGQSGAF